MSCLSHRCSVSLLNKQLEAITKITPCVSRAPDTGVRVISDRLTFLFSWLVCLSTLISRAFAALLFNVPFVTNFCFLLLFYVCAPGFSLLLSLRLAPPDSVGRGLSVVVGLPQG